MAQNHDRNGKRKTKMNTNANWGNRLALIGITVVVFSLSVVVHFGKASLEEKDLEYRAKEQNLEKILAEEEARAAQLEEYRIYVQTKQYVEKVAKEKLGLVKKDEILLKPKGSK